MKAKDSNFKNLQSDNKRSGSNLSAGLWIYIFLQFIKLYIDC